MWARDNSKGVSIYENNFTIYHTVCKFIACDSLGYGLKTTQTQHAEIEEIINTHRYIIHVCEIIRDLQGLYKSQEGKKWETRSYLNGPHRFGHSLQDISGPWYLFQDHVGKGHSIECSSMFPL